MYSWRALLVPPMMQFVHSSRASSLYSARVLLACPTRTADDAACAISERLGPLLDPGSLAGANFPTDAIACAISEYLGPLLDPGSPSKIRTAPPMLQLVQSPNAGTLLDPGSLAGTNCPADATACVVMTRPTMFQVQQCCDS